MSGKKAKESRRVKADVDNHFKTITKAMTPKILNAYHKELTTLSLRKRLVVCWKILMRRER